MQDTIAAEGIQVVLINRSVLKTICGVKVFLILNVTTVVIRHQVVVCNPPCILLNKITKYQYCTKTQTAQ